VVNEQPVAIDMDWHVHQLNLENSDYMLHRDKTSCSDHSLH